MNKRIKEKHLVEILAANTEALLAGMNPVGADIAVLEQDAAGSWKMVVKLAQLIPISQPERDVRNRIRAKLSSQWNVIGPGASPKRSGLEFLTNRKGISLVWAGVMLLVIVVTGLLATPAVIPAQSGSAEFHPAAIVGGLIILGLSALAYWWIKRKP